MCTTELTHPGPAVFLSDRDVSDPAAGVSCTNLKTAGVELQKLKMLFGAIKWLTSRS